MINIIGAVGKNNEIGLNNKLLWYLPNDLKFFKNMTLNKTIIMGSNTFKSVGTLPNRKIIVLTRNKIDNILTFNNINDCLNYIKNDEVFVIGGESIYRQFLEYANNLYLTKIDATTKADTYFPHFDKREWNVEHLESGIDNGISYQRNKYVRKKVK